MKPGNTGSNLKDLEILLHNFRVFVFMLCLLHSISSKDAQILPCGHSFCPHCLSQSLSKRPLCPLCQQPVNLSPAAVTIQKTAEPSSPSRSSPHLGVLPNRKRDEYLEYMRKKEEEDRLEEQRKAEYIPTIKEFETSVKKQIKQTELQKAQKERRETREYLQQQKEMAQRERENRIRKERGMDPLPEPVSSPTTASPFVKESVRIRAKRDADIFERTFTSTSTLDDVRKWLAKETSNGAASIKLFTLFPKTPLMDYTSSLQNLGMVPSFSLVFEVDSPILEQYDNEQVSRKPYVRSPAYKRLR
ncbi:hypothetical protein RCL1_002964 [Eukaryota sp. TZLM3-RCL]